MNWPSTWNSWSPFRTTQIVSPECRAGGWICSRKEKGRYSRVAQLWEDDWIRTSWLTSIIKVDIRVRSWLYTLPGRLTRKCPKKRLTPLWKPAKPVVRSLRAGFPYNIKCQCSSVVDRFLLVFQPLIVSLKGSTGVHRIWLYHYFTCSIRMTCSFNLYGVRYGWLVAGNILSYGMLSPGCVQ